MTNMLEKAVDQAKRLPEEQQDAIAALILEEMLEQLAREAREEDRQGLTKEFDSDSQ